MDWLKQFEKDFGDVAELKNLQLNNYFGKIILKFESGKVTTTHRDQTIKPKSFRDKIKVRK